MELSNEDKALLVAAINSRINGIQLMLENDWVKQNWTVWVAFLKERNELEALRTRIQTSR